MNDDKPRPEDDHRNGETVAGPPAGEVDAGERLAELNDRYLRLAAELDNYKKRRLDRDQTVRRETVRQTLEAILPAVDDLHRAVEHPGDDADDYRDGVRAVVEKLDRSLEALGVKRLRPLGGPFDPNYHECLALKADPDREPGTVVEVYADGYLLGEHLLRPAQVVVVADGRSAGDSPHTPTGNHTSPDDEA